MSVSPKMFLWKRTTSQKTPLKGVAGRGLLGTHGWGETKSKKFCLTKNIFERKQHVWKNHIWKKTSWSLMESLSCENPFLKERHGVQKKFWKEWGGVEVQIFPTILDEVLHSIKPYFLKESHAIKKNFRKEWGVGGSKLQIFQLSFD